ncbi:hypothetical protein D3C71_1719880 [compost metagenome]
MIGDQLSASDRKVHAYRFLRTGHFRCIGSPFGIFTVLGNLNLGPCSGIRELKSLPAHLFGGYRRRIQLLHRTLVVYACHRGTEVELGIRADTFIHGLEAVDDRVVLRLFLGG